MDAYCRNNCWLSGFFDYAFESASLLMMTTGGWHGLWIWATQRGAGPLPEVDLSPFLLLTFHNVATGMCLCFVWREFRMRYLPRGADRSVWETSHSPDAYFVPQTSLQIQKHFRHQLRQRIWKRIIVSMFERFAAPFFWLCSFPPVSKLIVRAWGPGLRVSVGCTFWRWTCGDWARPRSRRNWSDHPGGPVRVGSRGNAAAGLLAPAHALVAPGPGGLD
jgi:hypothetical protein